MVGSIQGLNNFHKYFMIPEKLMNGFIQSGHAVYGVNDRDVACYSNIFRSRTFGTRAFNAYLLKAAEAFAPDLVVIGNAEKLSDESIRRMRYLLPASRFVYVNVDSLSQAGNLQKINRKVGVVDAIFVTTEVGAHNGISHSPATLLCFMPNPVDKRIDQERQHIGRVVHSLVKRCGPGFPTGVSRSGPMAGIRSWKLLFSDTVRRPSGSSRQASPPISRRDGHRPTVSFWESSIMEVSSVRLSY